MIHPPQIFVFAGHLRERLVRSSRQTCADHSWPRAQQSRGCVCWRGDAALSFYYILAASRRPLVFSWTPRRSTVLSE